MSDRIHWGILGTGAIAKTLAHGLTQSKTGKLVAVASRTKESAEKFGQEFGISTCHASYEAMLADKNVQAVYIAVPHPLHAQWAIRFADAGKAVLCEKPFAINGYEAQAMQEAARRNNTFMMEAFMYRCHPQTAKVVELVKSGVIGEVRFIQAAFAFNSGFNPTGRLYANDLAGGGIMDVGCYPVSFSRLIAGAATGQDFADPVDVKGTAWLGETGVDHVATASLKFPGNIVAQVTTGVQLSHDNSGKIFGTKGNIVVPNPWTADRKNGGSFTILLNVNGQPQQEIKIDTDATAFAMEADVVGNAVKAGKTQAAGPAMSWGDTMGNITTLDRWRHSIGMTYNMEKWDSPRYQSTVTGQKLARRNPAMKYGRIAGLDKDISRLIMGVDNQRSAPHAAIVLDDYFERGGNAFDTAWVYNTEPQLGWWVRSRGVRDQVVLLFKGAHTPACNPKDLRKQIVESLERAKLDNADIYMMHRDNLDIPVGEFVDVLNDLVQEGRFKIFGGSNWTLPRIEAAQAYAKANDKQGFAAVSNNFSVAHMVTPVWNGCIHVSDKEGRAWHERTQLPLLPWSSQARGFFTDRAGPDKTQDEELVRCWYSAENFKRRERAIELAKKHNVLPINIALAYILCQPFPTFPLIGPRSIEETRTSMPGLDVQLTPDELAYLALDV